MAIHLTWTLTSFVNPFWMSILKYKGLSGSLYECDNWRLYIIGSVSSNMVCNHICMLRLNWVQSLTHFVWYGKIVISQVSSSSSSLIQLNCPTYSAFSWIFYLRINSDVKFYKLAVTRLWGKSYLFRSVKLSLSNNETELIIWYIPVSFFRNTSLFDMPFH